MMLWSNSISASCDRRRCCRRVLFSFTKALISRFWFILFLRPASGGSRGWQIRPWPPIEVGNGVWPPLGGRKSNDSTVNMLKSKDFGTPYLCRLRIYADSWGTYQWGELECLTSCNRKPILPCFSNIYHYIGIFLICWLWQN